VFQAQSNAVKKISQQANVLRIDTPLKVILTSNSISLNEISLHPIKIDQESIERINEYSASKDYIGPLIGLLGVVVGFILGWIKDFQFRKRDKKEKVIEGLELHRIKINRLLSDFYSPALEIIDSSIKKALYVKVNGKETLAGKQDLKDEIQEAKQTIQSNLILFKKLKEDLLEELEYFKKYMSYNICFNDLQQKIKEFDPEELLSENHAPADEEINKSKAYELGIFQVQVLERILRLCELFITEYDNSNHQQIDRWLTSIYFDETQNTFTTRKPKENS